MIGVARVQHAVKQTEAGTNRGLMIGERVPCQTNSRINVVQRWVHGCGLLHGDPLAIRRIDQVVLFMLHRFDDAGRLITQANVQREFLCQLPLIVHIHRVDPVTIVLRRIGARVLRIRYLPV
jgi:hypothetical protein